uniref:Uncharacterized protein n=1 Tax=Ditylenchus dipsaci TaxID=166011 RepID=A0A915CM48_9BILA
MEAAPGNAVFNYSLDSIALRMPFQIVPGLDAKILKQQHDFVAECQGSSDNAPEHEDTAATILKTEDEGEEKKLLMAASAEVSAGSSTMGAVHVTYEQYQQLSAMTPCLGSVSGFQNSTYPSSHTQFYNASANYQPPTTNNLGSTHQQQQYYTINPAFGVAHEFNYFHHPATTKPTSQRPPIPCCLQISQPIFGKMTLHP